MSSYIWMEQFPVGRLETDYLDLALESAQIPETSYKSEWPHTREEESRGVEGPAEPGYLFTHSCGSTHIHSNTHITTISMETQWRHFTSSQ